MIQNLFNLGYISRAQGLKGEVRLTTEYPELITHYKGKTVYFHKGDKQFSFLIQSARKQGNDLVVLALKECQTRESAEALQGFTLLVEKDSLPKMSDSFYYPFELPGMRVMDQRLGDLGLIQDVYSLPAQMVASIDVEGQEVLFPLVEPIFVRLDRNQKILHTCLPDGLLEVYTAPGHSEADSDQDTAED